MEQVYNHTQNTTKPHASAIKTAASLMLIDATQLHSNANLLATNAKGSSAADEALEQKAGENDTTPGTLRYLAKELNSKADLLATAVGSGNDGYTEANSLANEVGANEDATDNKLRQKLKALAGANSGDLTTKAQDVRNQYGTVKEKFEAVQNKQNTANAYTGHGALYQAVVEAWDAFDTVYNADLKQLATNFATAVGDNTASDGLQKALSNLKSSGGKTNALDVIIKFNAVADKYKAVTALETTYKAITETKSHYDGVESKFEALQTKYSDAIYKYKFHFLTIPSMFTNWLNFLTYLIILIVCYW